MKQPPILVSLDHNEAMRPRAAKIEQAVEADDRFFLGSPGELPFDLVFSLQEHPEDHPPENCMHIELKDFTGDHHSDYLGSILSGHLWEQVLYARENGHKLAITVTGDDCDVAQAVAKAVFSRSFKGQAAADKIFEYTSMVEGFEANCIALGVPVWRLKDNPYKRMLLRVRKILQGGDLTGFAPAPADGERRAVGLSILAGKGIGTTKAAAILEKFQLILEPWTDDCYLTDCTGIGEKLARQLGDSHIIAVDCRKIIRPPKPKKARNSPVAEGKALEAQSPEKEGDRRKPGRRAGKAKAAKIAEVLG